MAVGASAGLGFICGGGEGVGADVFYEGGIGVRFGGFDFGVGA